jgi:hypothetical protein
LRALEVILTLQDLGFLEQSSSLWRNELMVTPKFIQLSLEVIVSCYSQTQLLADPGLSLFFRNLDVILRFQDLGFFASMIRHRRSASTLRINSFSLRVFSSVCAVDCGL